MQLLGITRDVSPVIFAVDNESLYQWSTTRKRFMLTAISGKDQTDAQSKLFSIIEQNPAAWSESQNRAFQLALTESGSISA